MTDAPKRPRGRPPKAKADLAIPIETTVTPAQHAAWKASGLPANAIFGLGLEALEKA